VTDDPDNVDELEYGVAHEAYGQASLKYVERAIQLAIDDTGTVPVPDGPSLGVAYDWDFVEEHEIGRREYTWV
jgi:L-alanine-DL-glutamate epimerase-like enolase superfamily enzyme